MPRFILPFIFISLLIFSCNKNSDTNDLTLIDLTTNNISPAVFDDTLETVLWLYVDTSVFPPVAGTMINARGKIYVGAGSNHTVDTIFHPETFYKLRLDWKLRNNGPIDSGSQFYPYNKYAVNYLSLTY